ncbi:MAG: hypothetical protein K1X86_09885 [Ignavibacteria bacterium]|nr:hypothetical protein [Ignavibacteria bacterium]
MKTIRGYFHFLQPYIAGQIKGKQLILGKGPLKIKIDTGFDGALCIPLFYKKEINHNFGGRIVVYDYKMKPRKENFYEAKVKIFNKEYEFDFIIGDFLIGMEFMKEVFEKIQIDFAQNKIALNLK